MRYVAMMSRTCSNKETDEGGQRPTTLAIQVTIMFFQKRSGEDVRSGDGRVG